MKFFGKKRRLRRIGLAVLVGLVVAYLITPGILRHVVKSRLQTVIAERLDADLEIGELNYAFPYSVDVKNAALIARGNAQTKSFELMHISHLAIDLAQSPLRSGPIVIQSVLIENPSIRLIKNAQGLVGLRPSSQSSGQPNSKDVKLSQIFNLHRLVLKGGKAIYEDQTVGNTLPLVWDNLNFDVDTIPLSNSQYAFHLITDASPHTSFDAIGTADIDQTVIHLTKGSLKLGAESSDERSPLPPDVQRIIQQFKVHGAVNIETTANVDLKHLTKSTYDTTIELRDGSFAPQGSPIQKVTAKLRLHDDSGKPSLSLAYLTAASGGVDLRLQGGSAVLDPQTMQWNLTGLSGHLNAAAIPGDRLTGDMDFVLDGSAPLLARDIRQFRGQLKVTPRQLRTVPHLFPDPIDQFTEATFTLADGKVSAKQLRAAYGDDVWFVKSAEVDLTSLPRELVLSKFEGCLTFAPTRHKYPAQIEPIFAQIKPVGPWFVDAADVRVPLAAPEKTDYHAKLRTPHGRLSFNDGRIPVYNIVAEINAIPGMVRVERFDAASLQGELHVAGWVQPRLAGAYEFNAKIDGVEMHDILTSTQKPGAKPVPLSGRANVVARAYGIIPPDKQPFLDMARADGTFAVENGNFWQIPLFKELAESVNVKEALTVGDAFGTFTIAHNVVHLDPVAVSAPVLGVQGSGDVGFNEALNLDLVAIPGQVGKSNGKNAIGNVLAQAQQVFAFASKTVLYKVHIGGTVSKAIPEAKLAAADEIGGLVDRIQGKKSQ